MSDIPTNLERLAEAGVAGIRLLPLRDPRDHRRARTRSVLASIAAICIVVAAVAVAISVRSPQPHRPQLRGGSTLVANASYVVPSGSMDPTLKVGDVVSGATNFGTVSRGDVVRVRFPRGPQAPQALPPPGGDAGFKRVVALSGETVEGRNGHVFVNGRELVEPYLHVATGDFSRVVVPRDSYFVLGDNRPSSADSRQWGPVHRSEILAVALRITAPSARAGAIAGSPR
jgi:signal peptidase I